MNPWDIPPFPTSGDMKEDTVYASVGRALSSWELFECRLSRIFSGLTGRINGNISRGTSLRRRHDI